MFQSIEICHSLEVFRPLLAENIFIHFVVQKKYSAQPWLLLCLMSAEYRTRSISRIVDSNIHFRHFFEKVSQQCSVGQKGFTGNSALSTEGV